MFLILNLEGRKGCSISFEILLTIMAILMSMLIISKNMYCFLSITAWLKFNSKIFSITMWHIIINVTNYHISFLLSQSSVIETLRFTLWQFFSKKQQALPKEKFLSKFSWTEQKPCVNFPVNCRLEYFFDYNSKHFWKVE